MVVGQIGILLYVLVELIKPERVQHHHLLMEVMIVLAQIIKHVPLVLSMVIGQIMGHVISIPMH